MKVHLSQAAFTPSLTLTLVSFTEATFVGYGALSMVAGSQMTFIDPATGNLVAEVIAPGGGYFWKTTAVTSLPQTIYGAYLTDNGNATLYGSQLLNPQVTLTAIGHAVELPNIRFTFPPSPIS